MIGLDVDKLTPVTSPSSDSVLYDQSYFFDFIFLQIDTRAGYGPNLCDCPKDIPITADGFSHFDSRTQVTIRNFGRRIQKDNHGADNLKAIRFVGKIKRNLSPSEQVSTNPDFSVTRAFVRGHTGTSSIHGPPGRICQEKV